MIRPKISICRYPATTLLVDDNPDFLLQIQLLFATKNMHCFFYSEPTKALQFLNKEYKPNPFIDRCISTVEDRDVDRLSFDLDFRKIHHEVYNPNRFSELAVIVADYAMPSMNGLEFCRNIHEGIYQKMLLTGEASQTLAIEAFNEGSIDKFITKSALDLPKVIMSSVQELQSKYFLRLSEVALSKLYKQELSCLTDPVFYALFNYLYVDNQIVEYYLLDEHGSFLMLDIHGNPSWLIVKSEKDMHDLHEYAVYQDAPAEVIKALKNRTLVPYFHSDEDLRVPFDNCEQFMHPAKELKGDQNYYYAYLKNTDVYQLDVDRIVSFEKYLENV